MVNVNNMQSSFVSGEVSPALYGRLDFSKLPFACKNMTNFVVRQFGGMYRRGGTKFVGVTKDNNPQTRLIRFSFSAEQQYLIEAGNLYFRFWQINSDGTVGVVLKDGVPYEVATPYTTDVLANLRYTQSGDYLYIVNRKHAPRKLIRRNDEQGNLIFDLELMVFNPVITPPTELTTSRYGGSDQREYKYVITSVDEDGEESLESVEAVQKNSVQLTYNAYNILNWTAVEGAERYYIYRLDGGLFTFIAETKELTLIDDGLQIQSAENPPNEFEGFKEEGDYPGAIALFKQRLILAGTEKEKNKIWFSAIGLYENFSELDNLTSSSSFNYSIDSGKNTDILHLVATNDLTVLASDSEWTISSDGALAFDSAFARLNNLSGSSYVSPFAIGSYILYLSSDSRTINDLGYSLELDGYKSSNLSLLSEHLFSGKRIVSLAFQQNPDSILWCVRNDGCLLGMTYNKEQNIYAWSKHTTKGLFKDCLSIDTLEDDRLFLIVERDNGVFIEELTSPIAIDETITDCYYVDSGFKEVFETEVTTLSGLSHLEGQEVSVVLDGNNVKNLVVKNGSVSLPYPAKDVTIGLSYSSDFQSLPLQIAMQDGSSYGRKRRACKATIYFEQSRGTFVGTKIGNLWELRERTVQDEQNSIPLQSGFKEVNLSSASEKEQSLYITSSYPFPANILNYTLEIDYAT